MDPDTMTAFQDAGNIRGVRLDRVLVARPLACKTLYSRLSAEGAVFARLASGLLRYCEAARSGPFPRKQESGSPIWSPRARAPFSNHHQTAGKQSRLSRGFSMGPWPLRGSNGLPWRALTLRHGFSCDFCRSPLSESSDVSTCA